MATPPASTSAPSTDQAAPRPPSSTTNQDLTTTTTNPPPQKQSPQSSRTPGKSIPSRASDEQTAVATEEARLAFLGLDPLITALLILMGAALLIIVMRARARKKAQDVYR